MEQYDANDLLIFARVIEHGSFSRAAERIGLPKSTVSRRISVLEERLGERLLQRTTRRLQLTEFGQLLLEHARQVVAEVDAVTNLAAHRQAQPSGRLRVSMPNDVATLLLTDMIGAFISLHPAITLELDLSPRRVDLLGENFDLAIRIGSLPDDSLLAARRLASITNGLYATPDYLAEHGEPQTPDALSLHETLRLMAGSGPMPWVLQRGSEEVRFTPTGRIAANSPELLIRMAVAGSGIAAVPDYFARPYLNRGALRRVLPEWSLPANTAWAVFPGRHLMPAKTRAFIDMLLSALRGVDGGSDPSPHVGR